MTQYWGAQDNFFYEVFIILKILGGGVARAPLLPPYFAVPELVSHSEAEQLHRY